MSSALHIDFESRSSADLKKTGVHKYAEDTSTDILCMAFAFDDEPVELIRLGDPLPKRIAEYIGRGGTVTAHNAAFELAIWNIVCVHKYGWPGLAIEQVNCTMARALAMALPASLENCAAALGLDMLKDLAGQRLMLKYAKPRKVYEDGRIEWWDKPEDLERIYAYCKQDVEVERAADKRLLQLPEKERKIWVLDQQINNRGVMVDTEAAQTALALVDEALASADSLMRFMTGNEVASCSAVTQLTKWLQRKGIQTDGVAKDDIAKLLAQDDLPEVVREVLLLRQEAAKSSTRKLEAMLNGASSDGRLRGLFQYSGAGATGRWAGRRVQPQNLPRPNIPQAAIEDIIEALDRGDARAYIEALHGPVLPALSNCLRSMLMSATPNLVGMDFSAIEARVLAWLAGEEKVLEAFRGGADIYKVVASAIFGVPVELVTKDQRQVGKVALLALGYQGGVGAFQAMAVGYGVRMAPALPALQNKLDPEQWEKVCNAFSERGVKSGIAREEWLASEITKMLWREAHENIVGYWYRVEAAAIAAVQNPGVKQTPNNEHEALPEVLFLMRGSFLFCKLPSGRNLCYPYPKVEAKETPWGTTKAMLTYMAVDSTTNKWCRHKAYGGLLVENITQAVARDLLADAMLRLDEAGINSIVMHVHDEVVIEQLHEQDSEENVQRILSQVPAWAEGLPMAAEGWTGLRYRKG